MSTLCAIRFGTCQHFYHCHIWCHELLLLRPDLIAFYAKLNEISKIEFHFALEVSFSIYYVQYEHRRCVYCNTCNRNTIVHTKVVQTISLTLCFFFHLQTKEKIKRNEMTEVIFTYMYGRSRWGIEVHAKYYNSVSSPLIAPEQKSCSSTGFCTKRACSSTGFSTSFRNKYFRSFVPR